jgi:ribonuclease BN (tRNA processing enzyme)
MELKFTGVGSAFNPKLKNTSAYFTMEDNFFLVDCGESVFASVWDMPELRNSKDIYVIITHLHADHVGSLASLISYTYYILEKKIHVIHPIETIVDLLTLSGIDKNNYFYYNSLPKAVSGVKVEAVPVEHVRDMKSFGYVVRAKDKKIFYSGDSKKIPDEILKRFLEGDIDRLYQDTAISYSENPSHMFIGDLMELIPSEKRDRVYCMHLEGDNEELIRSKGFNVACCEN